MPKLSKILIIIFLALFAGSNFAVFHLAKAEIEVSNDEEIVYVCPNATSLEEVRPDCPGRINLKLGKTIEGMTLTITIYEGKEYYVILGFVNGGAGVEKIGPGLETQIAITEMFYGGENILNKVKTNLGIGEDEFLLLSDLKESAVDLEDGVSKLNPGQTKKLKMKFKFLETAGNEYQGKSINVKFIFNAAQEKQ